jgi:SAM-dependent methyltransferase
MNDTEKLPVGAATYSSAIADAHRYMAWIVDSFAPHLRGPILEVGIGHGQYCRLLSRQGDYIGIDHDPESVVNAQRNFPGLRFEVCDILDSAAVAMLRPVGSIVSINVFEHIENDRLAIANLVSVLEPGSCLCVIVPALMSLYNDLDRMAGHVRRYTLSDWRDVIAPLPVSVRRLSYFNPIGGVGWWVNKFRRTTSLDDEGVNSQIRVFDRYVVPVSRAIDPLFRPFFGQSAICILERK